MKKNSLLGEHLDGKKTDFELHDDSDRNIMGTLVLNPAPHVFVHNVKPFLFECLDRYAANNKLYWHGDDAAGCLPLDKIFIKVGSDKGRGSMKICFSGMQREGTQLPGQ